MLVLRRGDLEAMLGHARAEAPRECCGLLGGRDDGALRRVAAVHPCRNAAPDPEWAYAAEPRDQLAAMLAIEDAQGLEVVGVYHSHPRGPPRPSAVDEARANLPGASYVVLWLGPEPGWGSWRWRPGGAGFVREEVAVEGDTPGPRHAGPDPPMGAPDGHGGRGGGSGGRAGGFRQDLDTR